MSLLDRARPASPSVSGGPGPDGARRRRGWRSRLLLGATIGFGVALRRGRHPGRADTLALRGSRVRVSGDAVPGNIDGEVVPAAASWSLRVEPQAWTMRIPAR